MKDDLAAHCPIARSLLCVGDSWSVLILRDAHLGLTRFDQFRKSLGIAPTMLTARLTALTDEGLLEKRRYIERPPRDEYVLTNAGRDFLPVLVILGAWGSKHRGGGDLTRYIDAETGKEVVPIAVDLETGAKIGTRPITMIEGGAAPAAPRAPGIVI
ncbi:MAG: helix-turn-helix transcriptional regulator [Phenylobacterium sp.]|uniref:winged helix-turn-helix transcriptional regulator n=1 Tax=Phenylobacterium sp. TaxID=1871053 RepID=UPI001B48A665|nr:helix-turn-helix domain-containing protein [Phenylobacterium sp.]MBP7815838.1 helix-turn-helix transcriptional regulator [Phenylobacterium sp.]MBP9232566.1 helix-turn-helix transcriptional regulator [Phenylobacterium sp.]MBP9756612.1 helix-turn-helix transcriptional regulator [Phenylobacterium sp.]